MYIIYFFRHLVSLLHEFFVIDLVGLDSDIELSAVHQYLQDQDIQGKVLS